MSRELTQTSFRESLLNEREETAKIVYAHQDGLMSPDEIRKKHIAELDKLLSNKLLIDYIDSLAGAIHTIDKKNAKKHLSTEILDALKAAEIQCENKQDHKWNMLFLVHNYNPKFWVDGIDNPSYRGNEKSFL